ncbi:DUF3987 domain-containing protein [Anaerobaca lacustris]|uniref:DUF3987 domain-containing protein n=1 Tax=Anaerobaca lacustris TaxID=3044600 RepID=A0AAW6U3R6_9BACT|nr:DUF3987 domain-containing protein [Sedimentisphaerales bacterium M17dextr]
MSNACRETIGIRRRFPSGGKAAVKGSQTGLFVPLDLIAEGPLLIVEGESDLAAALDLGFSAIGRPNCTAMVRMTVEFARLYREVVVVGDNDEPGHRGADAGLAALDDFAVAVEKNLRTGGEFESMRDWAGKLVGAVCRIAGILHGLMHTGSQGLQGQPIDLETTLGAIAIGEYLVPHAQAAFFEMGADPAIDIARKILGLIEEEALSVFSKRDAFNKCRGAVHKVTEMDEPIRLLADHGYIRERQLQRVGSGRKPSPTYEVNPLWLAQNTHNTHNYPLIANSADSAQCAQEVPV